MTVDQIIRILQLAGTATPAFAALFEQIKGTFSAGDLETVEAAYAASVARAEEAHRVAQGL